MHNKQNRSEGNKTIKSISVILIMMLSVLVSLSGCSTVADVQTEEVHESADDAQQIENVEEFIDEIMEEVEEAEVLDESYFKNLLMEKENIPEDEIIYISALDYEGNGNTSAFIFTGEVIKEDNSEYYEGDLWFVNDKKATLLENGDYRNIDIILDFGDKKYYGVDVNATTLGCTTLYEVHNGKAFEAEVSKLGIIEQVNDNEVRIWVRQYDGGWSVVDEILLGGTNKPYYFHYDEGSNNIVEDIAEEITRSEAEKLCGFDIAGEVENRGFTIGDILYRNEEIVTVNYSYMEYDSANDPNIEFDQANWDVKEGKYLLACDWHEGDEFNKSGYEGIYLKSIRDNYKAQAAEYMTYIPLRSRIYAEFLEGCTSGKYLIDDIDGDYKKELLYAEGDSHVDQICIYTADLDKGTIVELGKYGCWGSMSYCPEDKYIIDGYANMGESSTIIYAMSDVPYKKIVEMWNNAESGADVIKYLVNGKAVSAEEYERMESEYYCEDSVSISYTDLHALGNSEQIIKGVNEAIYD